MRAIIKEPGKTGHVIEVKHDLEELQRIVGGYIEMVPLFPNLVALCDEDGRLKGSPYNCELCGILFVGTILLVGVDGSEFADVPMEFADLIEEVQR